MGHLHQSVKLSGDKVTTVRMLVDTGATFSVISKSLARTLGVAPLRGLTMTLADGRPTRVKAGMAIFEIGKRKAPATLLVGDVVEPILGVETLEALGLAVDPRRRRLTPTRPYTIRLGGYR